MRPAGPFNGANETQDLPVNEADNKVITRAVCGVVVVVENDEGKPWNSRRIDFGVAW